MKKTIKDRYFKIETPPYCFNELFVFVGKAENFDKALFKVYRDITADKLEERPHMSYWWNSLYDKKILVTSIYMPTLEFDAKWLGCLMHEIQHVAFVVFKKANVKITAKNDEAFTYFCEYVFEEICKKYFK